MRAYAQLESADDRLGLGAIFSLPATWWQRACFRAELRADLRDNPDFLRDIGIGLYEAQAEALRFFWEPLRLEQTVRDPNPIAASDVRSTKRVSLDVSARHHTIKDLRVEHSTT
ncbi:hypothetical protein GA0061098_1014197 [Bradyrhizobium shewense]|uniref:DUF1127 domain-containing protein n=1 Tax=Bradyrhizobium shewense TaxID=1761772 RepID=A0A1C3XEH4_9BRAD|nr:hypothetical protein [Bradyrhizobium shewense]SCB50653.1 hypothetical protein GA0061098_1014197 [Bradyrhizobium shewense]